MISLSFAYVNVLLHVSLIFYRFHSLLRLNAQNYLNKSILIYTPKRTKYFLSITKGTGYIWPERWNSFSNDNCEMTRLTACKTHVSHSTSILFFDCNFRCGLIVKLGPKNIFNEGTEFQLLFTKVIFARVNSLIKGLETGLTYYSWGICSVKKN